MDKAPALHIFSAYVACEFTATLVGRLVTTLMKRTGDRLGENGDIADPRDGPEQEVSDEIELGPVATKRPRFDR